MYAAQTSGREKEADYKLNSSEIIQECCSRQQKFIQKLKDECLNEIIEENLDKIEDFYRISFDNLGEVKTSCELQSHF